MKYRISKMRKVWKVISLVLAVGLVFTLAGTATALADTSKDEKKLDKEAAEIDETAGQPQGGAVVVRRLEKEFNVTEAQITALRDQKLGYGEIAIVFSLAKQLGGTSGITQENIDAVMTKRLDPPVMGWGEIAKSYNLKLGAVVSQVKKVETASTKEIKQEERTEHKMMKEDRHQGSEKRGGMERTGGGRSR